MLVLFFPQDGSSGGWRGSFLRLLQTMLLDLGDLRLEINKAIIKQAKELGSRSSRNTAFHRSMTVFAGVRQKVRCA